MYCSSGILIYFNRIVNFDKGKSLMVLTTDGVDGFMYFHRFLNLLALRRHYNCGAYGRCL